MKFYYDDSRPISKREPGIPTTAVTNELAEALNRTAKPPRLGQVDIYIPPRAVVMVQLSAHRTGGGKYTGNICQPEVVATQSASTNLTGSDFGQLSTTDDCEVWNPAELNADLHALDVGEDSSFLPALFTGSFTTESPPKMICILLDRSIVSVIVKITATASGGGKYIGKILRTPTADINPSTNLVASDIGAVGDDCVILNALEVGVTGTWDIDPSGPQVYFYGMITKFNSDETPIVVINGFQWGDCA